MRGRLRNVPMRLLRKFQVYRGLGEANDGQIIGGRVRETNRTLMEGERVPSCQLSSS